MGFVSLSFLFLFLPAVFLVFFLIRPKYANAWLLLAGFVYCGLTASGALPVLLTVILVAYLAGIGNRKIPHAGGKRFLSAVCIVFLTALLFFFRVTQLTGMPVAGSWLSTLVPLGASFYVLQAVMYIADTCRGEESLLNPVDLALYLSFFPKLISGPLCGYRQFRERLDASYRTPGADALSEGVWRIAAGFCKKALIADPLGSLAGTVFEAGAGVQASVLQTWLCVVACSLQLYIDFSAYSDMAIGMGKLFGYELPENFRDPYAAGSLKEFWRRWHISLSSFFRDYVYIPLGGNRKGAGRWILSLAAVWLLTGLWHGLSWNFVIWGMAHGLFLMTETLLTKRKTGKTVSRGYRVFGHVYTLLAVMLLWVVFRAGDLRSAGSILARLFGIGAGSFADAGFLFQLKNSFVVLILGIMICIPKQSVFFAGLGKKRWYRIASAILLTAGVIASVASIYMNSYQPFLYSMF